MNKTATTLALLLFCSLIFCQVSLYTPNGTPVVASTGGPMNPVEIAYHDSSYTANHPLATLIASSSLAYNHGV